MQLLRCPWKHWTLFGGLVADGDDEIKRLVDVVAQPMHALGQDVNAHLGHGLDGERVLRCWMRPGAECQVSVWSQPVQETLRHLRSRRVMCAQEQYPCGHMCSFCRDVMVVP